MASPDGASVRMPCDPFGRPTEKNPGLESWRLGKLGWEALASRWLAIILVALHKKSSLESWMLGRPGWEALVLVHLAIILVTF